jgi:hypothetical protein
MRGGVMDKWHSPVLIGLAPRHWLFDLNTDRQTLAGAAYRNQFSARYDFRHVV